MASGKQGLYVVVWEWENKQRRWRPYPPEVTQQLERAHSKHLRTVFLGDSDPSLKDYCINLSTMQQESQLTGERVTVRRNFYPQSSPAGQGAVWEWSGDNPGDWHVYDMCVQCVIEASWATGAQTVDMSETFPLCPYIINFCNLTQMNSRTRFVRAIRRVQQAAYPVGKRPATPQQPQHDAGPSAAAAAAIEKQRRRGSRDDVDPSTSDAKPRAFLNKVFGRSNGGCAGGSGSSKSSPTFSDSADSWPGGGGGGGTSKGGRGGSNTTPKPKPRSQLPPVPKPRTNVPVRHQHYSQQQQNLQHQHHHHNHHQQHQHQHHPHPHLSHQPNPHQHHQHHYQHQHQHQQDDLDTQEMFACRTSRNEAGVSRYGSDRTLDSDCSSINGRRPSVDTISTYLSMDDDHNHNTKYQNHDDRNGHNGPVVDRLIRVGDSDEEMMEDDVFSEDQEVCAVMRGIAGNASPPRAPSPPPHDQHPHHYMHHPHHSSASSPKTQTQGSYLFTPITAVQPHPEADQQANGVKRKRTGERAASQPSHGGAKNGAEGIQNRNGHNHYSHATQHHPYPQTLYQGSRAPIGPEDRLLLQFTRNVGQPPDEMCSICMWNLQESSGFSDDKDSATSNGIQIDGVVSLNLCDHMFHLACVREMAKATTHYLECPNCKTMHGEKQGNQPEGRMKITIMPQSLPGYKGCETIQITYCINDGVQGPSHPHPGRPYRAIGFPRKAYLPNNDKGNKVLNLLQEAFQRKLIFTIGTSVTSGIQDTVTWNEIHHKTEWRNVTGHGYPDPNYLDNVLMELALQGVTESTLV